MAGKRFLVYFLRWQASAVVMLPFMHLFKAWGIGATANLLLIQAVGSVIFYNIDKRIFK